jgi:polar amino acid transport system substrate-binding protein
MKKIVAYFAGGIGALSCFFITGCGPSAVPKEPSAPPLRVGMDLSYPPFESLKPGGEPEGVSVEIAKALAAELGRPLKIENIPFTGLIPSLKTGKIDIILSSMTDTPERRKSIAFSDPYLSIGLALLVAENSPVTSKENLDEPGRVVAVRQGTTGQVWAEANLKKARLLVLEKENAAVLEVLQGKADAFIYDQMSVWKQAQQHPGKLRALLDPLQREYWAIGLRPEDNVLREQINAFLKKFREEGGFEKLSEKFLPEQKRAFDQQGIEFFF